jgi:hypothetical protein
MSGYIFKRPGIHGDEFWRGRMRSDGTPAVSLHRCDAYVFETMKGALQCADTHEALKDSQSWKVVVR